MAFAYTPYKRQILDGTINHDTAGDDIRVLLVGTLTTADTEQDTEFLSAFTTLDETIATSYVRQALANEVVNQDDPNDRAEFDADDVAFGALGNGVNEQVDAAVYFKFVTVDADSPAMVFVDTGGFPFTTNGGTVTIQHNAEGIIQAT